MKQVYKQILPVLFLILLSASLAAQTVDKVEYWFDDGFAGRQQANVTAGQQVTLTGIAAASANTGLHNLHIRAGDNTGNWSVVHSQVFFKSEPVPGNPGIATYEYWLDDQFGSRVNKTASGTIFTLESLDMAQVSEGLHTLHIRAKGTGGWSVVHSQIFFKSAPVSGNPGIATYEYWMDDQFNSRVNKTASGTVFTLESLDMAQVPEGLHTLHIRAKGTGGWSVIHSQAIYKYQAVSADGNKINAYRYFFNGAFNAATLVELDEPVTPYELNTAVEIPETLEQKKHAFHIQFRDLAGKWSVVETDSFVKTTAVPEQVIYQEEFEALKDFYTATGGNGWTHITAAWDTASIESVTGWQGVTLQDGHVVALELSGMALNGSIPASIHNLTGLKTLILNKNHISGLESALPATIDSLDLTEQLFHRGSLYPANQEDITIPLPDICFYNHEAGDFSALPVYSVYLNHQALDDLLPEAGMLTIPQELLEGATSGDTLKLIQQTGDARYSVIRYVIQTKNTDPDPEAGIVVDITGSDLPSALADTLARHGMDVPEVTRLKITGDRLTESDFKYIRDNMQETLQILDINEAGIEGSVIPNNAFYQCTGLTSVILPSTLTRIGSQAFYYCPGLIEIHIPSSVTEIGELAFYYCSGLTSITVDAGNTAYSGIDGVLFNRDRTVLIWYPEGKTDAVYTIPSSVNTIGTYAFAHCSRLRSVNIPSSVRNIEELAFAGCSGLTSLSVPNSVTAIGRAAFESCSSLTDFTIPSSITVIEEWVFNHCRGLTSVTIPSSVTVIKHGAFSLCTGLVSLSIPSSVADVGGNAFIGCSGLVSIMVDETNPYLASVDGVLYNKSRTELLRYPAGKAATGYTPPDYVNAIGNFAFTDCGNLRSVTIPASVTSIGRAAFSGCRNMTSLIIGSSVNVMGDFAFETCSGLTTIYAYNPVPANITYHVFSGINTTGCVLFVPAGSVDAYRAATRWKDFVNIFEIGTESDFDAIVDVSGSNFESALADTLVSLGKSIVNIVRLKIIGNELTAADFTYIRGNMRNTLHVLDMSGASVENNTIPSSAFMLCSNLTSVTIPNSVTHLGMHAFYGCNGLSAVTLPEGVTHLGYGVFSNCTGLTSITIPDGVVSLESSVFYQCTRLESVTFPSSVTNLGIRVFEGCSGLISVTLPNGITKIGDHLFSGCTGLKEVFIPSGVTSIGNEAFLRCSSLTSIIIPDKVTTIGYGAFYECISLTSLVIPASVSAISSDAFIGCSNLASFTVHEGNVSYSSENGVLFNHSRLMLVAYPAGKPDTDYVIPNSVTSTGSSAFRDCANLTSVTIPASVSAIGYYTFRNCTSLTSLYSYRINPVDLTNYGEVFESVNTDVCVLYVPAGSVDAYRAASQWNAFANIRAIQDENIPVSTEEFVALKDFYEATGGERWRNITGKWNVTSIESVSGWHGVTLQDGHVVALELDHNGLEGSIPASLSRLTQLHTLSLQANYVGELEEVLPVHVGTLNLEEQQLHLGDISLSGQKDTTFTLPNICLYDHAGQNFSASPSFSVYMGSEAAGSLTAFNGRVNLLYRMIEGVRAGDTIKLVQNNGDAKDTRLTLYVKDTYEQDIPAGEFAALKDFFEATGGGTWKNTTAVWDTTDITSVKDWYGVTVTGGHVTAIALTDNQLKGYIPASLSQLTQLKSLYLSGNSIEELEAALPEYIEEWSLESQLIERGEVKVENNRDVVVTLSSISTYRHSSRDFEGAPAFNVLIAGEYAGSVTAINGRINIPAPMLSGVFSGDELLIVQNNGDAQQTVYRYLVISDVIGNISGKVTRSDNGSAVNYGKVYLYPVETGEQYFAVDSVDIQAGGTYSFERLTEGKYLVRAVAGDILGALPTYYGNTDYWMGAVEIELSPGHPADNKNIGVIILARLNGTATISGYITESERRRSKLKSVFAEPYYSATIILQSRETVDGKEVWVTIAYTRTDEDGFYAFENVSKGEFRVMVDIPGIPQADPHMVSITADGETLENINYEVSETEIAPQQLTGISDEPAPQVNVYPNPFTDYIFVEVTDLTGKTVVCMYDMAGRPVYKNTVNITGNERLRFDLPGYLGKGVYILVLENNKSRIKMKIVKE